MLGSVNATLRLGLAAASAGLICASLLAPASARPHPARPAGTPPAGAAVRFEHLTIEAGLSQNAGLAVLQDRTGYLWIGTQDGLNRYDGYTFTVFKHDPANPASLSHNSTLSLMEDRDGQLWIGTWGGGLNRYDPATGRFTRFAPDPGDPAALSHGVVTSLLQDSTGAVWVGTLGGLDRFDPATGGFEHFRHNPADPASLSADAVSTLLEDARGNLWVGTGAFGTHGAGLNRFERTSRTFTRFQHDPADADSLAGDHISSLAADPSGRLWVGLGGYSLPGAGLDLFDPGAGRAVHFRHDPADPRSLSADQVFRLLRDQDGSLWVGTWGGGLDHMAAARPGEFTHHQPDPAQPHSLNGDSVWSLFQDRSGVLWVGMSNAGLNRLSPLSRQFHLYRHRPGDPTSLSHDAVGAFAEDPSGALWVGTWGGGLDRFDPATGRFENFRHDPADANSLSNDLVMALHADEGGVWIGTLGGGLDRLETAARTFTHYPPDPAAGPGALADGNIAALLPGRAGDLWIGTFGGLHRFDPRAGAFTRYHHDPADDASLSHDQVVSLQLTPDNRLWIGTWGGGLNRLDLNDPASADPQTARFTRYRHADDEPASLSDDNVWAIHRSADGLLWLGTQGGLNRFDPASGVFKAYREKDGLRNATVLGVMEAGDGQLWLTTNNGLARFDPRAETFVIYDAADGLQGGEFNSNAWLRTHAGLILVGGGHGFNLFDPAALRASPVPPPVVLTDFQVFNVSQPITPGAPLRLSHDQDFIAFEFAALDFRAPSKNVYAYKLEGFDDDWVQAGTRRYASYTNLPGGNYTLRVKAANGDGVWNEAGLSVPLVITPPLWETGWFRGLGIVALAAVGLAIFQARVYAIRAQNRQLEAMVQQRTVELRQANARLETEVEQRKRAEAELARQAADDLRASEARFQAVFENAAVGIALMGLDRRIFSVNAAGQRLTGYTAAELRQIAASDLAVEADREIGRDLFEELIAGRRDQYTLEKRYRRKDGSVFWGRVNFSAVRDAAGQARYLVGLIEDITETKEAEARLAAQAAEHRRLLEQRIAERTDELNRANALLQEKAAQEAVAAERTRLARDLHDAVTQTLFAATLIAEVLPQVWNANPAEGARRLEDLRQLTRGALAEMRTLLVELRPNALVEIPLGALLRQLTEAVSGRARLPIQFSVDGERALPPDVQVALYRIAQEALNNVVKHARASQAFVTARLGRRVRLTVADNGAGFDPAGVPADHLGLRIMRERAEGVGAQFSVYSERGEGTQISVTWEAPP
mgnify:CR=1 FL=1